MTASTISQYITVGVYPGKGTYGANLSVTSLGTINTADRFAVSFSALGYLSNDGLIRSTGYYGVGLSSSGGTITNADPVSSIYGTIDGIGNKSSKSGDRVTVVNSGVITGNDRYGIKLSDAATVTNTGTASLIIGGQGGIIDYSGALTVTNQGSIKGVQNVGVRLGGGGIVTNSGAQSYIYGAAEGVYTYKAAVITNAGTMSGGFYGVYLRNGGTITNTGDGGVISGTYSAIGTDQGGTVVNDGILAGQKYFGIFLYHGGVVTNAGTISGGRDAIDAMYGQFTLDVEAGAVFAGNVVDAAGGGTLVLGGSVAGSLAIDAAGSTFTGFSSIYFGTGADWTLQGNVGDLASGQTITGFTAGNTIDLTGIGLATAETFANGVLTLTSGSNSYTLDIAAPGPSGTGDFALASDGNGGTDLTALCFCAGTWLRTPGGEVQVQALTVGDAVVTARNEVRRIVWIGVGRVLATRGRRGPATPVIVRKNALGSNVPYRDLRVTKGHALWLDGVLIPVEFLVNHRTILWDDRAQDVPLYHIELGTHDVLVANGAPAESYRDDGNRWLFQNANSGWGQPAKPCCAPVLTGGPIVDAVWRRLLDRAGPRPGVKLTGDPDLHLLVDGVRVDRSQHTGDLHVFRLARAPREVRIASRAAVPAELGVARDMRCLGVAVRRVMFCQATRLLVVGADDRALCEGFHAFEPGDGIRWTNGDARVAHDGLGGFSGGVTVELLLGGTTVYPLAETDEVMAA